jgi:hypothetical protein
MRREPQKKPGKDKERETRWCQLMSAVIEGARSGEGYKSVKEESVKDGTV